MFKYKNYNDITIRSKAKNGGLTEIDKLIDGKGQIYFYGVSITRLTKDIQLRIHKDINDTDIDYIIKSITEISDLLSTM